MKNHAVSVRARLLNLARAERTDFQRLLIRFAIERLLFRLSVSAHSEAFVLKGATLFAHWLGTPHRATKDLDLLGRGAPTTERLVAVFSEVLSVPCEEDGLLFDEAGVVGGPIRAETLYQGVRVVVPGSLAGAVFRVQVDIGMGDATVPAPRLETLSTLLPLPHPQLRAYRQETVIAEKLEALVVLGIATSRMKDLYDLDLLGRRFEFGPPLVEAISATFARRGTPVPGVLPVGLSNAFATDPGKQVQWKAFLRKSGAVDKEELESVVARLRSWLWPVLCTAREHGPETWDSNSENVHE